MICFFPFDKLLTGDISLLDDPDSNDGDVSGNHGTDDDYWVAKLDANGNIVWQKYWEEQVMIVLLPFNKPLTADILLQDILIPMMVMFQEITAISDYWIVKLDANGNIIWQKSLGGMR